MHSTYFKNFVSSALLVLISLIMIGAAFSLVSRDVFITHVRQDMLDNAGEVARAASAYAEAGDLRSLDLRMTLTTIGTSTKQQIFITTPGGYVVACSDARAYCEHIGMRIGESVLSSLSRDGSFTVLSTLDGFYAEEHYVSATTIPGREGGVLGFVFVSKDAPTALAVWHTILPLLFLISLVVLLLALVFSYAGSKMQAQPLRDMADAARRFGQGDLSVRVENAAGTEELGELTQAFNSMADSLEKSEEKRREFIANVSHELKTPMTTISGFADGILDGTIPPEMQDKYLQIISSETKRLSRLVRSMLELSRLQADDRGALLRKSFDIAETLRLTIINFADKIEDKGLDVDFQVPEDPMPVRGDCDAITQVVYNLMDNAIKFSKEGSALGITLWKDNDKAYVSVRNHGATIPEAEIPLLFDRFHKGDRSRSHDRDGVGLGLYIVKTILLNHGEDIAVTSRQGVTDFVFSLSLK